MPMPFHHYRPYATVDLPDRTWPDVVLERAPIWCSTDLRDGNQALVNPMDAARKRRFFDLLVRLGVKEIEVGFPAASKADFDFCRVLVEDGLIPADTTIAVLTQARPELIERTYEAIEGAPRAIVHLYNSTSETQRRVVFRLDRDGITELAVGGTALCKALAGQTDTHVVFQYSPESFHHTELEYALEICEAVAEEWGPAPDARMIVNLPTTVEAFPPNVYADRMEWFCRQLHAAGQRDHVRPSAQRPRYGGRDGRARADGGGRARGGLPVRERRADGQRRPDHAGAQPPDPGRRPGARPRRARRGAPHRRGVQRASRPSAASVRRRARLHRVLGLAPGRDQEGDGRTGAIRRRPLGRPVPAARPEARRPRLRGDHPRQLAVGEGRRRLPDEDRAPPRPARAGSRSTSRRRCRRSPTCAAAS